MANRRTQFWVIFLGAAGISAVIPEFFEAAPDAVVVQVARARPAPEVRPHGRLADLRSGIDAPEGGAEQRAARGSVLRAKAPGASSANLFAAQSWVVAPPPPPPPASMPAPTPVAAPAPVAPPFPYAYLGKLDDSQRLRVFLVRGERTYTVAEGDLIDGTYRVEAIGDTQMRLTYLPLNHVQTLAVGSKP